MAYYNSSFPKVVYAMQHKVTGRIYIGQTANLEERLTAHTNALRKGKHTNELMQDDADTYGIVFDYYILDSIASISESWKEIAWMDELKTGDSRIGYNYKDPHFKRKKQTKFPIKEGIPTPNEVEDE